MAVFVALEGPDCSGKDHLQRALYQSLSSRRYRVLCYRTPGVMTGDTTSLAPVREALREAALSGRAGFVTKRSLMAADAAVFCEQSLVPAMQDPETDVVLVNRYWMSDTVYAAAEVRARSRAGLPTPVLRNLSREVFREAGVEYPEVVIRMAPPLGVCWQRLVSKDQDGAERQYDRRFYREVYDLYEAADYYPSQVCVLGSAEGDALREALAVVQAACDGATGS